MLENFIRNYAEKIGFSPDLSVEVATPEDNQYVLTLFNKICVLHEITLKDRTYAAALIAFDKVGDKGVIFDIKKVEDCIRNNGGEIGFVTTDEQLGVIGFYASICLNDCDDASFFNFMQTLARVCAAVEGVEGLKELVAQESYNDLNFDEWLQKAGIARDDLLKSNMLLVINDTPVLVQLIESNKSVRLTSFVFADEKGRGFAESIAGNLAFNGLKGFSIRGNALYFESIICAHAYALELFEDSYHLFKNAAIKQGISSGYQQCCSNGAALMQILTESIKSSCFDLMGHYPDVVTKDGNDSSADYESDFVGQTIIPNYMKSNEVKSLIDLFRSTLSFRETRIFDEALANYQQDGYGLTECKLDRIGFSLGDLDKLQLPSNLREESDKVLYIQSLNFDSMIASMIKSFYMDAIR